MPAFLLLHEERQRLLSRYHVLPGPTRTILNLLAVAYQALNKTQIASCLRELLAEDEFKQLVACVQRSVALRETYYWPRSPMFTTEEELIREVRIGLYRRDLGYIEQQCCILQGSRSYNSNAAAKQ